MNPLARWKAAAPAWVPVLLLAGSIGAGLPSLARAADAAGGAAKTATTAAAPKGFYCPQRARTLAASLARPADGDGFVPVIGGLTQSQTWLQDVAVYRRGAADPTPVPAKPEGRRKLVWAFDGETEVVVACVYEGGVQLRRAVGKPRQCTANILRSKDPGGGLWGMDHAAFDCR